MAVGARVVGRVVVLVVVVVVSETDLHVKILKALIKNYSRMWVQIPENTPPSTCFHITV
jgi:hypothetical protein